MKNKKILLSTIATAILLIGCGSGGGSGTTPSNPSNTNQTVQVERGAVLNANVTDANGNIAKPISKYSNTYKFDTNITYPVRVTSGIVDVNGNGQVDSADFELTTPLVSSNSKVSFLSTLIYDSDETKENKNFQKILEFAKEELSLENLSKEEFLSFPSENMTSAIITNSLYKQFKEQNILKDEYFTKLFEDNSTLIDEAKVFITNLKTSYEADTSLNAKQKAQNIEAQVINSLEISNIITTLSDEKIDELNEKIQKGSIYFDKSMIQGKTYYFLNSSKDEYFAFSFGNSNVEIKPYIFEEGKWEKEENTEILSYSVKNSEVTFLSTNDTQKEYLNKAFENNFVYNDELISTIPEELKDLEEVSNPPVQNKDISFLLNKKFYDVEGDSMFSVHEYSNSYASFIRNYVKDPITEQWQLQPSSGMQDQALKEQFTKIENNSVVFEYMSFKSILKIKEFHNDYILINFHMIDPDRNVNINTDDKWYLNAPALIPESLR